MINKKLVQRVGLGLAGVGLVASLSGCIATLPLGVPPQQVQVQWMDIDKRMGYLNHQGYGIVPLENSRYYIYQYVNGRWVNINERVKYIEIPGGDVIPAFSKKGDWYKTVILKGE